MGEEGGVCPRFFMDGDSVFTGFSGIKKTFEEVFYIFDLPGWFETTRYLCILASKKVFG